jgi:hypothetical protein
MYDIKALSATQASLAQLVERGTSNAEVTGSTPLGGSVFGPFLLHIRLVSHSFYLFESYQPLAGGCEAVYADKHKAGGLVS